MKNFAFCFFVFYAFHANAQEKITIYLIEPATSKIEINNHIIKTGDVIPYKENLSVKLPDEESYCKAYMQVAHKILVISRPGPVQTKKPKGQVSFLLKEILPETVPVTPASKGVMATVEEFQSYLAASDQHLANGMGFVSKRFYIPDRIEKAIPENIMKLDESHYLFCWINYRGDWFERKIACKGQSIILDSELYKTSTGYLDTSKIIKIKVYYKNNGTNVPINEFKPVFLSGTVKDDISSLKNQIKNMTPSMLSGFLYGYFIKSYGYMDRDDFMRWQNQ